MAVPVVLAGPMGEQTLWKIAGEVPYEEIEPNQLTQPQHFIPAFRLIANGQLAQLTAENYSPQSGGKETGEVLPDDFIRPEAEETFRTWVPAEQVASWLAP